MPHLPHLQHVNLKPGEHFASKSPVLISTLLGSCVAACLYDQVAGVAGMNHFMLVNTRYARSMPLSITDAGRYGVHAMELLINDMMRLGADRRRLRAKVFGGGNVLEGVACNNFTCVGEVNERFIREYLVTENIELVAADLGGTQGRVIRFRTDSYAAYRRFIVKNATLKLERREEDFWERSIRRGETDGGTVVLFDKPAD